MFRNNLIIVEVEIPKEDAKVNQEQIAARLRLASVILAESWAVCIL